MPYINGIKHLGNLVGSLLPADIYARYLRQHGQDVVFICGTDEHGAAAEIAAQLADKRVEDYCHEMYTLQKEIYERFELSFDYFGRSSNVENHELTQRLFLRLFEHGFVSEREVTQLYDVTDNRFLPDRFVVGTCPHCGFAGARGDQCENCTRLLDAIELVEPRSAISGSTNIEVRKTTHLYLRLPAFQERLTEWVESRSADWSASSLALARAWLREGLQERCITRDLSWGIPVPLPGFENKTFYVWFDAPNAYIAITMEWSRLKATGASWTDYWKDPNTRLVQFMAKDNVPFHAIIWPAVLMGADDGYILPDVIKGFQYLNYYGGKFSTSSKRGVFMDDALQEFPADYWRYYLLSVAPETSDSDFNWNGFQQSIDNIADALGNFINRTLTFVNRYYGGSIPPRSNIRPDDETLWLRVAELAADCDQHLANLSFTPWLKAMRQIWTEANRYFDAQAPWATRTSDPPAAAATIFNCVSLCRSLAVLCSPLIPDIALKIFHQLGEHTRPSDHPWAEAAKPFAFAEGKKISAEIYPLFKKIDGAAIQRLEDKYKGGSDSLVSD